MKGYRGGMIMHDTVEVIGRGSLIQHGKHNDRIYLIKLDERDTGNIFSDISSIARDNRYSKIFCKVPKHIAPLFFAEGFFLEAYIPEFYCKKHDVFFVSKFLNSDRLMNIEEEQLSALHNLLSEKTGSRTDANSAISYNLRKLDKTDIEQITDIYRIIFKTYPFPIHDPDYILKTMNENVQYYGAEKDGKLAALSSAEIDFAGENAEMTDFATHPDHTGHKLSMVLLQMMEREMQKQGINTLYTIARLNSVPMNKTFSRNAYVYSGTLIKNTNIAGRIESMNVYYKHI